MGVLKKEQLLQYYNIGKLWPHRDYLHDKDEELTYLSIAIDKCLAWKVKTPW